MSSMHNNSLKSAHLAQRSQRCHLTQGHQSRRRGAAAVELAITVPLLFFLLLGVIETGRHVRTAVAVSNAARNGATYASATAMAANDAAAIRRAVLDEMAGFQVSETNPTVPPVTVHYDARSYGFVTVRVEYRFAPLLRLPFLPPEWKAVRQVRMRVLSQ
jgi:Flp pilus assembly protein TadG